MRSTEWAAALLLAAAAAGTGAGTASAGEPAFRKVTLDKDFWSEGVAIADINKDGRTDVFAGDVWYENAGPGPDGLPKFTRHEAREPQPRGHNRRKEKGADPNGSPYDGGKGYSRSFACFAGDFNADGWTDFIVVNFPGEEFHWLENPKGKPGRWPQHAIWRSACNETPWYGDLLGDGKPGVLVGIQPEGQMAYFRPGADPTKPWPPLTLSKRSSIGTAQYYHGLGVSDLNKDGRKDVLIPHGWWEQPAKHEEGKPWTFHPDQLVPAKHNPPDPAREQQAMADLFAFDVDGDGDLDLIGSSAHKYGIWWFEQVTTPKGIAFLPHVIREDISETHAMRFADIDGDGKPDIVTGKRYYSHMRGEPGSGDPAVLIWISIGKGADGKPTFTSHEIDRDSGVGTQFEVADFDGDGKLDVITANKKGVHLLLRR